LKLTSKLNKQKKMTNKTLFSVLIILMSINSNIYGQTQKEKKSEKIFIKRADQALDIMQKTANDMKVKGVAIVFFIPGETTHSWISKMKVVGRLTDEQANFLAIANAKASEMAETLMNSGSGSRQKKTGELGWMGGIIKKIDSGYLLAAFSGAESKQDAEISTNALNYLSQYFN
jgi:hypothetical protein